MVKEKGTQLNSLSLEVHKDAKNLDLSLNSKT